MGVVACGHRPCFDPCTAFGEPVENLSMHTDLDTRLTRSTVCKVVPRVSCLKIQSEMLDAPLKL
jgi:hypothetical protein